MALPNDCNLNEEAHHLSCVFRLLREVMFLDYFKKLCFNTTSRSCVFRLLHEVVFSDYFMKLDKKTALKLSYL